MARVVVIGAGLSGLSAAARLARLRHDVTVLEQATGPGGQAGRFERNGFAFDTGPTTLTMPASYRDLFIKTGKTTPLDRYLDLRPVDPAVRWCFADGTRVDIPNASRAGTIDAVGAAFGSDAPRAWDEFIACGDGVWQRFRQGLLHGPPKLSGKRFRVPAEERAALDALNPDSTYAALTDHHLRRHPHLLRVAHSWPLRIGSNAFGASAGVVLWPWLEHTFGVWAPVGGVRALVDVLAERARTRGADLRYDTEVTGVEVEGGAVCGVRLRDGQVLPADVVVVAVDDRLLARWSAKQPARADRSCSASTLLLALQGLDDAPFRQLSLPGPGGDLAHEDEKVFGCADQRPGPAEESILTITRAKAPDGCSAFTVTAAEPRQGDGREEGMWDWTETESQRRALALIAQLDDRGFDISRRLLWHEFRSPGDLGVATGTDDGAMAGTALHGLAGLIRPPNATGVGGLFHVGAAAHPGPGIAFAPLGAALVADAVGRAR